MLLALGRFWGFRVCRALWVYGFGHIFGRSYGTDAAKPSTLAAKAASSTRVQTIGLLESGRRSLLCWTNTNTQKPQCLRKPLTATLTSTAGQ